MGVSKKEFEKTVPVFQKQQFQRELDFYLLAKEKQQKINKPTKTK
jgi:hypothetical protein